ncbi:hypothetical protein ABC347_11420 [Sphingomonas sp. 1P06PA]|uniref:hypothetical protein n=1 Tax=Sphingomonas sp. 1P06PA TaxID=554121 RepID=UPI0039A6DCF8
MGFVIASLLLSGCSAEHQSEDAVQSGGPNVAVTAAPGVAFNYAYRFAIEARRIAAMQEMHAAACEALGIQRCRITALRFSQPDDHNVSGELTLALAPSLARRFGRNAVAVVERGGGRMVSTEIGGTDTAPETQAAERTASSVRAELAAAERLLASSRGSDSERGARVAQVERLRADLREISAANGTRQASLATTPVTLTYFAGDATGLAQISDALRRGGSNILTATAQILYILISLGPWIVALMALAWTWRRIRRRFFPDTALVD